MGSSIGIFMLAPLAMGLPLDVKILILCGVLLG